MHRVLAFRHFAAYVGQQCCCSSTHRSPAFSGALSALCYSTTAATTTTTRTADTAAESEVVHGSEERKRRLKNISRSLELYLESLRAHEKMMRRESAEFELGKRHLANIMGWPANMEITQTQIDQAIEYLFPSGLFDKKALPVMKPPEEILPRFHKMEFDAESRPLDPYFYTLAPKFYGLLSEINRRTLALIQFHDRLLLKGDLRAKQSIASDESSAEVGVVDETPALLLAGSSWIPKEALSHRLDGEKISDDMYASFIMAFDYLTELPLADKFAPFIMEYREHLAGDMESTDSGGRKIFGARVPEVQIDPETNQRFAVGRGVAKRMVAEVRVTDGGSGEYTVNGHHYSEFRPIVARELLLCPLIITDLLGKVDVSAKILEHRGGGTVLVPRTVRHGVSLAIAALYPQYREMLRLAGLLTVDLRRKERSKVNQPGARAKWIWKKR